MRGVILFLLLGLLHVTIAMFGSADTAYRRPASFDSPNLTPQGPMIRFSPRMNYNTEKQRNAIRRAITQHLVKNEALSGASEAYVRAAFHEGGDPNAPFAPDERLHATVDFNDNAGKKIRTVHVYPEDDNRANFLVPGTPRPQNLARARTYAGATGSPPSTSNDLPAKNPRPINYAGAVGNGLRMSNSPPVSLSRPLNDNRRGSDSNPAQGFPDRLFKTSPSSRRSSPRVN